MGGPGPAAQVLEISEHELGLVAPPEFSQVSLSPDGTYVGAVAVVHGQRTLTFYDRATSQPVGAFRFAHGQTTTRYAWASERRVVIEIASDAGDRAEPVNFGEIYSVDVDGANPRVIFGYQPQEQQTGTHIRKAKPIRAWGKILDALPDDPDHILVTARPYGTAADPESVAATRIYLVDVRNGVAKTAGGGPGPVHDYLTAGGEARVARRWVSGVQLDAWLRDPNGGEWRSLQEATSLSANAVPIFVATSGDALFALDTTPSGKVGLFRVPLAPLGPPKILLEGISQPQWTVPSPDGERVIGLEVELDYPKYVMVDEDDPTAKCLSKIAGAFAGEHARLVDTSRDGRFTLVQVVSDRDAGRYYVGDCERGVVELLFPARGGVNANALGVTEAIRIKASDGFVLHGYLTLPPGDQKTGLPLVVLPHGGPHGVRDHWELDPDAQLLASRGYAVLRVNFRGSGGYGREYEAAGYGHWPDRVVDDVVDATRWTIQEGIADPTRIGIAGYSFGAFAAAMAAIRAPELFRCVVGHSGLYDLNATYSSDIPERESGRRYLQRVIGPPSPELTAASPVGRAAELTVPVLLLHGNQDLRTPLAQAEAFRDALKAAQKAVKMRIYDGVGHGFIRLPQRIAASFELLAFLDQHLGVKAPSKTAN